MILGFLSVRMHTTPTHEWTCVRARTPVGACPCTRFLVCVKGGVVVWSADVGPPLPEDLSNLESNEHRGEWRPPIQQS